MRQYVVYKNPADVCGWPRGRDVYVVREWFITSGPKLLRGWIIAISRTLEDVRMDIPAFADVRMDRHDHDDECIVEVWI
jgi:hypothetical protein